MIKLAAETLKMSEEEVLLNCKEIPEANAAYFWQARRGGIAVIVGADGGKLAAGSALRYEDHLKAYLNGKRN